MFSPKKSITGIIALSLLASVVTPLALAKAPLSSRPNCINLALHKINEEKIVESTVKQTTAEKRKMLRAQRRGRRSTKLQQTAENISIGVTILQNGSVYYITTVTPGSAADQAGLLPGDEIYGINGVEVGKRYTVSTLLDALNGPEGSSIQIEIARNKDGGFIKKTLVRKKPIVFSDVETSIDADGIGYVRIRALTPAVASTVRAWFATDAVGKAKGVVIDLRTNPVGDMQSLLSILSNVLAKGTNIGSVVSSSTSVPLKTTVNIRPEIPTVALVNEGGLIGAIIRYAFTIKTQPPQKILVEEDSRGKNAMMIDGLSFAGITGTEAPSLYCADSETFTWDLVYKHDIYVKPEAGKDAVYNKAKMILLK